jgi:hypothetical protein
VRVRVGVWECVSACACACACACVCVFASSGPCGCACEPVGSRGRQHGHQSNRRPPLNRDKQAPPKLGHQNSLHSCRDSFEEHLVWPGVVMRTSCRKNSSHSGAESRQARMHCCTIDSMPVVCCQWSGDGHEHTQKHPCMHAHAHTRARARTDLVRAVQQTAAGVQPRVNADRCKELARKCGDLARARPVGIATAAV